MDGATDISILSEAVQREVTRPAATLHRHRTNNATASGTVEGEPGLTEQELQFIASLDDSPIAHFLKYTCEYLGAFRVSLLGHSVYAGCPEETRMGRAAGSHIGSLAEDMCGKVERLRGR